jgi:hypothetical protein
MRESRSFGIYGVIGGYSARAVRAMTTGFLPCTENGAARED